MDSTVHGILQNTGVGSLSLLRGNLPNPGIELRSPTLQEDSLPTELWGKPSIKEKRGINSKVWHLLLLANIVDYSGFWYIMSHEIMTKAWFRQNSIRKTCWSKCAGLELALWSTLIFSQNSTGLCSVPLHFFTFYCVQHSMLLLILFCCGVHLSFLYLST